MKRNYFSLLTGLLDSVGKRARVRELCYEIRTALYREFITDIEREDVFRIMLALKDAVEGESAPPSESAKRRLGVLRSALIALEKRSAEALEKALGEGERITESADKYGASHNSSQKMTRALNLITEVFIKHC